MSTHKITPETNVPFPCWLWASDRCPPRWMWIDTPCPEDFTFNGPSCIYQFTHYSTNPPDQPPLGEPAPEGSLPVTEPQLDKSAKGLLDWAESLICNGVPMPHCTQKEWDSAVTKWRDAKHESFPDGQPVPTPSAPSLQSVAEGAATDIRKIGPPLTAWPGWNAAIVANEITRHFAPVYAALTERDERIKQLETDNDTLRAAQKACEDCMTPTYAALRTRCEELERDKERLDWLEMNRAGLNFCDFPTPSPHVWKVTGGPHPDDVKHFYGDNYRAAIDAARKEGQQAHEKGEGK